MMMDELKLVKKKQTDLKKREKPMTRADFDNLQRELEEWARSEKEKIKENRSLSKAEISRKQRQLLEKEIKLLQKIDELRQLAGKENRKARVEKYFKKLAAPERWVRDDGRATLVTTPKSMQAAELHYLYKCLERRPKDIEERLDILLKIRYVTRSRNTILTQEIDELINKEADILNRARPESSLLGLRKRLAVLFLEFIESPDSLQIHTNV